MNSSARIASILQRIEALDRRMEAHMRDPLIGEEMRARMAHLHAEWRELLAANIATMESMTRFLRRIGGDVTPLANDETPPGNGT
jgi:hypothetical protein